MSVDPMLPAAYRVLSRQQETSDSTTLTLEPVLVGVPDFAPGQFTMLCVPGTGEIAISVSGDPARRDGTLTQTIRSVGAVSRALHDAAPGATVGVRGPFGTGWPVQAARGHDVLVVAGGVGLAPLRPVILALLADREAFGRVVVVAGARRPQDFLFRDQLLSWTARADLDVHVTVDVPAPDWDGPVGFVTEPLLRLDVTPGTHAFLCGPEPMMRFAADVLLRRGVRAADVWVSLERTMHCGIALCGHCQLGPLLVCRDGPVVSYDVAAPLLAVRGL